MPHFPVTYAHEPARQQVLSVSQTLTDNGLVGGQAASTAWPSANLAIFVPVRIAFTATAYKMIMGAGATAAGNFDLGIYDPAGNRLVSTGSTAKGANTEQVVDITDTIIRPGTYYLAMSADGANNYILSPLPGTSPVPDQRARVCGVLEMASAFPLPATATFAAVSTSVGLVPHIVAQLKDY